jgi:hypothetical protein
VSYTLIIFIPLATPLLPGLLRTVTMIARLTLSLLVVLATTFSPAAQGQDSIVIDDAAGLLVESDASGDLVKNNSITNSSDTSFILDLDEGKLSSNGTETAEPSEAPTPSPTATPDECALILQGNIPFFIVNSRYPDEIILFSLDKIPGNMDLYLTDRAWNGKDFVDRAVDDGTVRVCNLSIPLFWMTRTSRNLILDSFPLFCI